MVSRLICRLADCKYVLFAPSLKQNQWYFAPSLEILYNFVAENQ